MPTYEYQCQSCRERTEAAQKFTDPPLTTCPACGGELRKVFSGVGIVFKGSGFYKNDSRSAGSSTPDVAASASATATKESAPASVAPATPTTTPSTNPAT